MARRYSVQFDNVSNATGTYAIALVNSISTVQAARARIYDFIIGSRASVADNACTYNFQRFTAAGTSTAFTPVALDPGDAASLAASGVNATVTPTYTANAYLLNISANQRATFRWIAAPGSELVIPATTANGIGVKGTPTTAFNVDGSILFEE